MNSFLRTGLFVFWILGQSFANPKELQAEGPHDRVMDIFRKSCAECHGASKQRANLRLDTLAGIQEGGDSGPLFVVGKPEESLLLDSLIGRNGASRMPPKGDPLPKADIELFRSWIAEGAPFPKGESAVASALPSKHWSYQKVQRPAVPPITSPNIANLQWGPNPIDAFVAQKLQKEGLLPSSEASTKTLFRRASLDLTGLPPDPDDMAQFLGKHVGKDPEEVYLAWVDRLIASEQYGERWARHWLDQARYADSNGYSIDAPRSMWPWRDWVIKSLNSDLPFDQFTIQQLAGDLLPNSTIEQRIATGFHRNTQINEEGGIDKEQFRIESVFDRVATTGSVWLGTTLQCCQCHNHKYDPITQREFYRIFAFLNNQDEPGLTLVPAVPGKDKKSKPEKPAITSLVLAERTTPRETRILLGGDFTRPGMVVDAGTPAAIGSMPKTEKAPTRLEFAKWLVSKENPLTARVTVNRHWGQFFGLGIVETENDFGVQGSPPSHPELLDWLAAEFMEKGWSLKKLHRLIVTSKTYRQSSHTRTELDVKDPRNRLLARQKRIRLEAEGIRDVALLASGLLSKKVGGPSVFPPQPPGIDQFTQVKRPWVASEGPDRYRRGLYTWFWRAAPHPALSVFDAPDAGTSCTRRNKSNTPLQALTLLNDQSFLECSHGMVLRVLKEIPAGQDRSMLIRMFELCTSREPDSLELNLLEDYLAQQKNRLTKTPDQARLIVTQGGPPGKELSLAGKLPVHERASLVLVGRLILNLDETITRE